MPSSSPRIPLPLLKILEARVLPLWKQGGMERCLIAPHDLMDERALEKWLATGASISPSPYQGQRHAVKGPRNYRNRSALLADWPEDKLHERRSAVFACVIGGHADFQVGDQLLHCGVGHSWILLPGTPRPDGSTPHLTGENLQHGQCEILWLSGEDGSNSGLGCWVCHSEGERHFEQPGESCIIRDPALSALFEGFLLEASQRRERYREISDYLFQALLIAMCRSIREGRIFQFNFQKDRAEQESPADKVRNPIPAAQKHIENYFHQPLRIDDLARQFFLSRTEFTQRFRRETGKTFLQYLTQVRLDEARRLLENTDWSMEMIGKAVGFPSSRLRVLFNRHYGMPPQQFRKQCQSTRFANPSAPLLRNPSNADGE